MEKRKDRWLYLAVKWCVKTLYPRIRVEGLENLPTEGAIIVGNHCKMNGPIASELYAPGKHYRSEERRVGKECRSRWSPYH